MNPTALAAFVHKVRRQERILTTIVTGWKVTGENRHACRRLSVVERVAAVLREPVTTRLAQEVSAVVVDLGGARIAVGNRRLFRGVHPRGLTEDEALCLARKCRDRSRSA